MIAHVNGIGMHYTDTGGIFPLIAVHGGMGIDGGSLRVPSIVGLATDGIRVVVPDQRGHGQSSCADASTFTHAQWADDLRALGSALGLGKFALLGHSYGGFLALEFATRWPERLSHLVLVSTSPGPRHVPFTPVSSDASLRAFFRERWPQFFAGDDKHWPVFDQLQFSSTAYNAAYEHELPKYDLRNRIDALALPTLLVVGGADWYLEDMNWLATHLQAPLHVIENAGHMVFLEQPDHFTRVVSQFLRR